MFTRAKLLPPAQRDECARLVNRIETSVRNDDRAAIRDVDLEIPGSSAISARRIRPLRPEFPPRVEVEMVEFYNREWPM